MFLRPQIQGAISGPMLGEAAHRLLKNTLNIKHNNTTSPGFLEPPHRNWQNNHLLQRPRQPSGYGRGFYDDSNYVNGHHNPRGSNMYELQQGNNRQNFKGQERYSSYEEQQYHQNLTNGISSLTIDGGVRMRTQAAAVVPQAHRMPNPRGQVASSSRHQFVQNLAPPPSPPPTWIGRPVVPGSTGMHEKQVKKVYLAKSRLPQSCSDPGLPQ